MLDKRPGSGGVFYIMTSNLFLGHSEMLNVFIYNPAQGRGGQTHSLLGVLLSTLTGTVYSYNFSPMTSSSPSSSQMTMRSSSLVMSSLTPRWARD